MATRSTARSLMGGLVFLSLALPGCKVSFVSETETPGPSFVTPTPEGTPTPAWQTPTWPPTPEPTPTAIPPNGYRISRWDLNGLDGADVDGDGTIDNSFLPVYSESVAAIGYIVYGVTYDLAVANAIPVSQARNMAAQMQATVEDYYSVETFNALCIRAITGQDMNWVQLFEGSADPMTFAWYQANNNSGIYGKSTVVGRQQGRISNYVGTFGPAPMSLDMSPLYINADGEGQVLSLSGAPVLSIDDAWSSFVEGPEGLEDGQLGGVVWQADMMAYMAALIPTDVCSPSGDLCVALDIEELVLYQLEDVYNAQTLQGMWPIDGGSDVGVAIGFSWNADPAVIR